MMRFRLLRLVKVDRGMIGNGPTKGRHIPYLAGLVVEDTISHKLLWLDNFNSTYYLEKLLGIKQICLINEAVYERPDIFYDRVMLVTVPDCDRYIDTERMIVLHRNADLARSIAKESDLPPLL